VQQDWTPGVRRPRGSHSHVLEGGQGDAAGVLVGRIKDRELPGSFGTFLQRCNLRFGLNQIILPQGFGLYQIFLPLGFGIR
jgi:hypothetical protein